MTRSVGDFWFDALTGVIVSVCVVVLFGLMIHADGCQRAQDRQVRHDVLVAFRQPDAATHYKAAAAEIAAATRNIFAGCPADSVALGVACRDLSGLAVETYGGNLPLEYANAASGHPSPAFGRIMATTGLDRDQFYLALCRVNVAWSAVPVVARNILDDSGLFIRAYLGRITPAEIPSDADAPLVPGWFWFVAWCIFGICTLLCVRDKIPSWDTWGDILRSHDWKHPGTWASLIAVLPGALLVAVWVGVVASCRRMFCRRKRRRALA